PRGLGVATCATAKRKRTLADDAGRFARAIERVRGSLGALRQPRDDIVFPAQMTLVIRKRHVKLSAPLGILHVFGQPTHCRANHSRDESDGALERYRR